MTSIPRAAIYVRVSSELQEDNSSLPTQEASCRQYCADHGYQVVGVFSDVHTGAQYRERPGLTRLRELVRQRAIDVVVCHAVDRLSRNQAHLYILVEEFAEHGCRLEFVTEKFEDTAVGRFILAARTFAAEIEREKLTERVMRGRRARAESGKLIHSRVPLYGYQWEDATKARYVVNPVTAPVVQRIFTLALAGYGVRAIARTLTDDGIPSPAGLPHWNEVTVYKILTNPMYTGDARAFVWKSRKGYKRVWHEGVQLPPGTVPPLVDQATFEAVQRQLTLNRLRSPRRNREPTAWLLRGGFAVCGVCGHKLYACGNNGQPAYRCEWRGHGPRPRPVISAAELDQLVWQAVRAVMARDDVLQNGIQAAVNEHPAERELAAIERTIAQLKRQQANLAQVISLMTEEHALTVLAEEMRRVSARLRQVEEERDKLAKQVDAIAQFRERLGDLVRWRRTVARRLDQMDYREKRQLLETLGIVARVYPVEETDHERVEIVVALPLEPSFELPSGSGWGPAWLER